MRVPREGLALLPLRLFLGVTFTYAGYQKLADPGFFRPGSPTYIGTQLLGYARASALRGLLTTAAHHPSLTGWCVALAEVTVGAFLIAGLLTRFAALAAATFSLVLFLATTWDVYPYFLGADLPFLVLALTLALSGPRDPWCLDKALEKRSVARSATAAGHQEPEGGAGVSRREMLAATGAVLGAAVGIVGVSRAVSAARDRVPRRLTGAKGLPPTTSTSTAGSTSTSTSVPGGGPGGPPPSGPAAPVATTDEVGEAGKAVITPAGDPVLLVPSGNEILAYSAVCTHASCTVGFDPQRRLIVCPCHGSRFDPATGDVVRGPARLPLDSLPVAVRKGEVFLEG
jgi:thiosulfate dehydrogenase [quinone] large subunit